MYTLENQKLTISISSLGGELRSVKDRQGTEYLWQGDERYWKGRAPHLFPYIGRLTGDTYRYQGKEYQMDKHGFLRNTQLQAAEQTKEKLVLELTADEKTRQMYPFEFRFQVIYELSGDRINITFMVENQDEKAMYFGLGGHPGFFVPLDSGLAFEDYYLEFAAACRPVQIKFSENYQVSGEKEDYRLEQDRCISLRHGLFDHDAIVLEGMDKTVELKSDKGTRSVRVSYPDMHYLGFWHAPKTDAPYVCIEPWTSLCSRDGVVEDLETQPDLVCLEAGKVYRNAWTIEIQ